MYTLFWAPGTAAMAPHALLEEIGARYALERVDRESGAHRGPAYLKLNPNGRIPTLLIDGRPIFETVAICLVLAERHPEARLMPAPGTPSRERALQWLTWMTNTPQEALLRWYYAERYADAAAAPAVKAAAGAALDGQWDLLDAAIGGAPHVAGDEFSIPDVYLAMLARWTRAMPRPAWTRPNLRRAIDAAVARPAFQRMLAAQGLAWPG